MSNEPVLNPDAYPTLPTTKPTAEEDALANWFATQRIQSIDNLEGAARQIITLCTTLLTVLLGIVALAEQHLPKYMSVAFVRWLSMVGVLALFGALALALVVVFPRGNPVRPNDPENLAATYAQLLAYKNNMLTLAVAVFALAMLCLTVVILVALWIV